MLILLEFFDCTRIVFSFLLSYVIGIGFVYFVDFSHSYITGAPQFFQTICVMIWLKCKGLNWEIL